MLSTDFPSDEEIYKIRLSNLKLPGKIFVSFY